MLYHVLTWWNRLSREATLLFRPIKKHQEKWNIFIMTIKINNLFTIFTNIMVLSLLFRSRLPRINNDTWFIFKFSITNHHWLQRHHFEYNGVYENHDNCPSWFSLENAVFRNIYNIVHTRSSPKLCGTGILLHSPSTRPWTDDDYIRVDFPKSRKIPLFHVEENITPSNVVPHFHSDWYWWQTIGVSYSQGLETRLYRLPSRRILSVCIQSRNYSFFNFFRRGSVNWWSSLIISLFRFNSDSAIFTTCSMGVTSSILK